jgi:hypothetical protein
VNINKVLCSNSLLPPAYWRQEEKKATREVDNGAKIANVDIHKTVASFTAFTHQFWRLRLIWTIEIFLDKVII